MGGARGRIADHLWTGEIHWSTPQRTNSVEIPSDTWKIVVEVPYGPGLVLSRVSANTRVMVQSRRVLNSEEASPIRDEDELRIGGGSRGEQSTVPVCPGSVD